MEISEKTFIHDIESCIERINKYKSLGSKIAIDDFGIELSSLSILKQINFDILKLDKVFMEDIHDPFNASIIDLVSKISSFGNKTLIIEGVETKDLSEVLIKRDIFYHQGYYYHKPEKRV
jgi:EAL domain-containing protein (putative c-di-GMP-specific phosphodiesterase class I)